MKKSLILSIVMTLVLVISMSTATFAWYTANNSVTATNANITASTAAGNVKISLTGNEGTFGTTIAFTAQSNVPPMMPLGTQAEGATWKTAVKGADGSITYSDANVTKFNFYLSNVDSDEITLIITPTLTGANAALAKYAIYKVVDGGNTLLNTNGYNVLSSAANIAGPDATDVLGDAVAASDTSFKVATNATSEAYIVYMWFEGDDMLNEHGGLAANLDLNIGVPAQS